MVSGACWKSFLSLLWVKDELRPVLVALMLLNGVSNLSIVLCGLDV